MRPAPTPEQEELKQAIREFCAREVTQERLLAWESADGDATDGLRRAIAELGWLGLGLPASAGGSDASLVDVAVALQECARGLLPRSLVGAIRGAVALAAVAPESADVRGLAAGERALALALDEESGGTPGAFVTRIETRDGKPCVTGVKHYVPDAGAALHLVAAREGSGASLVLVEADGACVVRDALRSFGGDQQAHVRYEAAPVRARLTPAGEGAEALARLRRQQSALALAEMIGGMEAVLEMTVAYVKEREQFGQKIALFQAVRHQIAEMGMRFTAARHLAWQAITRVSGGCEQGHELASALAYVGQAFKQLCWTGHHLHGGAGFVVEHRLRFHSERAQSLCVRYAPEAPALAEIANALLGK